MCEGFGNQDAALHTAGEHHDLLVAFVPECQRPEYALDVHMIFGFAKKAATEATGVPRRLERLGRQLLWHQPDTRASFAVVLDRIVTIDEHGSGRLGNDATDDVDQRRLSGPVRTEKPEDFTARNVQIDRLERLEAACIGFCQVANFDGGLHGREVYAIKS